MIKDVIGCVSTGSSGTYGPVRFGPGVVRSSSVEIGSERISRGNMTQTVRTPPHPYEMMPSWRERVCAHDLARRARRRALCGHADARMRWGWSGCQ